MAQLYNKMDVAIPLSAPAFSVLKEDAEAKRTILCGPSADAGSVDAYKVY